MTSPVQQHFLKQYIEQFSLTEHLNADLLSCLRVFQFSSQQPIINALTKQTHLYFLVEGKAQISYYLSNGRRSIILMITPFAVVGDMELFEDNELQMNVIATEASIFLGIRKSDVMQFGYNDPRFLRFIIHYMSQKLRSTGFHQLSYDLPLINRLGLYLLSQPCTNNTIVIESKSLIADLLGTTARHLNRVIQTMENDDIIQWQRNQVNILDMTKLQSFGEL